MTSASEEQEPRLFPTCTAGGVLIGLTKIGFSDVDAGQVMGITPSQVARLRRGEIMKPLEERHALSNYLGFTRRARAWIAAAADRTGRNEAQALELKEARPNV